MNNDPHDKLIRDLKKNVYKDKTEAEIRAMISKDDASFESALKTAYDLRPSNMDYGSFRKKYYDKYGSLVEKKKTSSTSSPASSEASVEQPEVEQPATTEAPVEAGIPEPAYSWSTSEPVSTLENDFYGAEQSRNKAIKESGDHLNIDGAADPVEAGELYRQQHEDAYGYNEKYDMATPERRDFRKLKNVELHLDELGRQRESAIIGLEERFGKNWEQKFQTSIDTYDQLKDKKDITGEEEVALQNAYYDLKLFEDDHNFIRLKNSEIGIQNSDKKIKEIASGRWMSEARAEQKEAETEGMLSYMANKVGKIASRSTLSFLKLPRLVDGLVREKKDAEDWGVWDTWGSMLDEADYQTKKSLTDPSRKSRPVFENIATFDGRQYILDDKKNVVTVRDDRGTDITDQITEEDINKFYESGAEARMKFTGAAPLFDKAIDVAADLAIMRGVGSGVAAGASTASKAQMLSKAGVTATAFANISAGAYDEATKDLELSPDEAAKYAVTSAAIQSAIETFVGNIETAGVSKATIANATRNANSVVRSSVGKMGGAELARLKWKEVFKVVGGELAEEGGQLVTDNVARIFTNTMAGSDLKLADEYDVAETFLLTTLVTAPVGALNTNVKGELANSAYLLAVHRPDKYKQVLDELLSSGTITDTKAQKEKDKVDAMQEVLAQLPSNITTDNQAAVMGLVSKKIDLQDKSLPITNETRKALIESVDKQIESIILQEDSGAAAELDANAAVPPLAEEGQKEAAPSVETIPEVVEPVAEPVEEIRAEEIQPKPETTKPSEEAVIKTKQETPPTPSVTEEAPKKKMTQTQISRKLRVDSVDNAILDYFLTGGRIKTEHIDWYGDRNTTKGTAAKLNYGRKDGEKIDDLARIIAEEFNADQQDVLQRIIDFIHENPSGPKARGEEVLAQQQSTSSDDVSQIPEGWDQIPSFVDRVEAGEDIEEVTKGLSKEIKDEVKARIEAVEEMTEIESQMDDAEIESFNVYMEQFEKEGEIDMEALAENWSKAKRGFDPDVLDLSQDVYDKIDNLITQYNERKTQKSEEVPGEAGKGEKPTKTIAAKTIEKQIDENKTKLIAAKEALKSKAKELDKGLMEDQENLFGERDYKGGMFDERADASQREAVLAPLKAKVETLTQEAKRLESKLKAEEGKEDVTLFNEPTEADVVKEEVLPAIKKGFLKIDAEILANEEELNRKAEEITKEGGDVRKNVKFNIETRDGEKTVKAINADVVNGFYSPLEKIINESKQDKMPAKQWLDKFAKGDEAKWTGLDEWLKSQQGSISKADIQKFLKENRIEIVEIDQVAVDEAKYRNYQLPGEASKYKEVLVTMPEKTETAKYEVVKKGELFYPTDKIRNISHSPLSTLEQAQAEVDRLNKFAIKRTSKDTFKSSHFGEPNILVHLRMNTRNDADGNKVLFLEEIQSDWGQKGKREGFKLTTDESLKAANEYNEKIAKISNELGDEYKILVVRSGANHLHFEKYVDGKWLWLDEKDNINVPEPRAKELIKEAKKIRDETFYTEGTVAKAPFVTDTNSWTKLGLKVALKEAVKQGADKIAWTTGEQQNDRYDLSKHVKHIQYNKNSIDDSYNVWVVGFNGEKLYSNESATPKEIEDTLGKEILVKMQNNEGENVIGKVNILKDDNLKVGGKGMIGFYGSPKDGKLGIVGGVAKSLFKQEPKTINIETDTVGEYELGEANYVGGIGVYDSKGDMVAEFDTKSEANKFIADKSSQPQHSIDITPELRQQVSEGLPLFHYNDKGEVLGFTHNGKIYLNNEKITAKTTMEEAGHVWVNWTEQNRSDLYNEGIKKVEGTKYLKDVESNKNYQNEALKQGKKGSEAYDKYMKDEALVKAIADNGAKFVSETRKKSFKEWVNNMWRAVADAVGIRNVSPQQVSNMTLEEFARMAAADVFSKEKPTAVETTEEIHEDDLISEDIEAAFQEFANKKVELSKTEKVAHGKGFLTKPVKVKPTKDQKAKLSAAIKAAINDPTKENKAAARDAFIEIYESPYTGSKRVKEIWKQLTDTFPEIKEEAVKAAKSNPFEEMVSEASKKKPPLAKTSGIGAGVPMTNLIGQQTADLGDKVKFDDPDVEKRFSEAGGSTKALRSVMAKVGERLRLIYKDFTKKYPYLDYKKHAAIGNKLRELDGIVSYAKTLSDAYVRGVTVGLTTDQYDLLRRAIILKDLQYSVESGTEVESNLPFGFTSLNEVNQETDKINKLIDSEPDVKEAFELRERAMEMLHDNLVKSGLISDKDYKGYFHRRTLKYLAEDYGPETVYSRTPTSKGKRGFQKGRTGSTGLDYSTNFVESEFKVVAESIYELERKRILDEILAPYKKALKDHKKASSKAYEKALSNVEQNFGKTSQEYKEFEDGEKSWRLEWEEQNIPEGYDIWGSEGNNMFKAKLASEQEIEGMLSYAAMTGNIMGQSQQALKQMAESISRDYIVLGGKKQGYLMPIDVINTLDDLGKSKRNENIVEKTLHQVSTTWKLNTLFNPRRFLKYYMNNLSGDIDGLLAADPRILKKMPAAIKALRQFSSGEMTPLIQEALKHSVINSGLSFVEVSDINDTEWVKYLTSKSTTMGNLMPQSKFDKLVTNSKKPIQSYFQLVQDFNNFRENTLRLAAFIQAKENIANGKEFVWASQAYQIAQIEDDTERAAKLAREVLGDYGNISVAGEWLRKHMIPFYSWIEINMGRYFNLTSNAITQDKIAKGMLAKGITLKAARVAIAYAQMAAMMAAIKLFNRYVHPDCDKRIRASNMDGMYLIVGKNADGTCKTIPIQGAFHDFLQKFGLKNVAEDIEELIAGKTDVAEVGSAMGKAPVQEVVNGLNPFLKAMYELPSGQSLYPDVFNPRRIRDRGEYVARMVQAQDIYNAAKGKPTKHDYFDARRLENFITYDFDPDEIAYYAVKNMVTKEMGGGFSIPGKATQEKSDALYYYKQALRYKDTEAADKYLTKYYELGGMDQGLQTSIRNSHPLHGLRADAKRDVEQMLNGSGPRTKFGETLTEKDLIRIRMALNYYDKTFTPTKK